MCGSAAYVLRTSRRARAEAFGPSVWRKARAKGFTVHCEAFTASPSLRSGHGKSLAASHSRHGTHCEMFIAGHSPRDARCKPVHCDVGLAVLARRSRHAKSRPAAIASSSLRGASGPQSALILSGQGRSALGIARGAALRVPGPSGWRSAATHGRGAASG